MLYGECRVSGNRERIDRNGEQNGEGQDFHGDPKSKDKTLHGFIQSCHGNQQKMRFSYASTVGS